MILIFICLVVLMVLLIIIISLLSDLSNNLLEIERDQRLLHKRLTKILRGKNG